MYVTHIFSHRNLLPIFSEVHHIEQMAWQSSRARVTVAVVNCSFLHHVLRRPRIDDAKSIE